MVVEKIYFVFLSLRSLLFETAYFIIFFLLASLKPKIDVFKIFVPSHYYKNSSILVTKLLFSNAADFLTMIAMKRTD